MRTQIWVDIGEAISMLDKVNLWNKVWYRKPGSNECKDKVSLVGWFTSMGGVDAH